MLDELNDRLEREGKNPVAFESDCREGICGTCGLVINGHPHSKITKNSTCSAAYMEPVNRICVYGFSAQRSN